MYLGILTANFTVSIFRHFVGYLAANFLYYISIVCRRISSMLCLACVVSLSQHFIGRLTVNALNIYLQSYSKNQ